MSSRQRFREALLELDLDPAGLRKDPTGERWLPPQLWRLAETDPQCGEELRTFVATELDLYDDAQLCADPFFAAQIAEALPPPLAATGLTPRRRVALLAAFHVFGAVAAYLLLWILVPDSLLGWLDQAHVWMDSAADTGSIWAVAAAIVIVGFASVLPRAHTPAA